MSHTDRLKRFVELAPKVNLGPIFLDEFHDSADTTGRGKPFLRCIKGLIIKNLFVVPAGTEELAAVLKGDAQLATRFNFKRGRLPRLDSKSVVKAIMLEISGLPEDKITDAAVEFVLKQSKGILGHALDLTEETQLTHGDLALVSLQEHRKLMDVLDDVF